MPWSYFMVRSLDVPGLNITGSILTILKTTAVFKRWNPIGKFMTNMQIWGLKIHVTQEHIKTILLKIYIVNSCITNLCKIKGFIYRKHQTLAWPWYISEVKDDTNPIGLQGYQCIQIPNQERRISYPIMLYSYCIHY